jgi:hypothetical protein
MPYENPSNITGFVSIFKHANDNLMKSQLGNLLVVVVWFFAFFIFKGKYDDEQAFLIASFFSMVSSISFWTWEILSWKILLLTILLTFFSGIYCYFKRGQEY